MNIQQDLFTAAIFELSDLITLLCNSIDALSFITQSMHKDSNQRKLVEEAIYCKKVLLNSSRIEIGRVLMIKTALDGI